MFATYSHANVGAGGAKDQHVAHEEKWRPPHGILSYKVKQGCAVCSVYVGV